MILPIRSSQQRKISILPVLALTMAASPLAAQVSINEIRIDQPSTDNDEYFELAGPAATDLSALTYLVIGDGSGGTGGSGVIEAVVSLSGSSVTASGFFVAAESTFTLGTADLTTSINFENSDNVTHLLVRDFTGSNGQDLDTDDDGALDSSPWLELVDCIGLVETVGSGELIYCADTVGPDGAFVPGHVIDCPGGFKIGAFSPAGGNDTPGSFNDCGQVSVEISEIRIDQPGTDNDEYFELAGDAGDALDGLTYLVIGDGAGGSGVIESVVSLGGSSVPASGFFVAAESTFTIGAADLTTSINFENSDNVTHLVVRDFTGSNGQDLDTDDDGALDSSPWLELVDCIGLVETVGSGDLIYCADTVGPDGAFVPGHAIDCPGGFEIGAFDPAGGDDTPGAVNSCSGGPTGGALVINEIDYDQPGTDTAEFIEIYNADSVDVSLSGFSLELVNGNGTAVYKTIALPNVSLAAGDYFVVCANSATVFGCDLDVSPDTNLVQNGAPDAVALTLGGTIVDTVSYEGDVPGYTEFSGVALVDDSSGGTGGPNENKSISRLPDGFDTNQNNIDFQFVCSTPGAANSSATANCPSIAPPNLLINEIDYDQPGSDAAEFIEILNNGTGSIDLTDIDLLTINGSGGGATIANTISLPSVTLGPGGYFVVCGNAVNVVNCDLDVTPSTNLIQNGAPDAVALVRGGIVLDAVSYEGDTGAPYTEGSGSGLEDSGALDQDFRGIGRFPDGTDTNVNNVDLVNACITPGGPNTSLTTNCTAVAPTLEIWEIQGSGQASLFDGQTIQTQDNVVTAVGTDQFAMQTPTARSDGDIDTSDGIVVFTGGAPTVEQGDVVTVTGEVIEFFGLTEFSGFASVDIVASGNPVPAPVAFDPTVPSPDPTTPSCSIEFECYEGMLIKIMDGTVTGPNQRFSPDPIAEVHITAAPARTFREPGIEFPGLAMPIPTWDGNPEVFELDPDKLGLANLIIPAGSSFSATGVLGFEFGGYELWPNMLEVTAAPLPLPVRAREAGEMTVGTLNLFRLFDDVDDDPDGDRNDSVVGTEEYQRRLDKFSVYILDVLGAPDILAVQEVEKLGVLADLAAQIEADDPSVVYSAMLEEGNDIGTIDVGFLVRSNITVDAITQVDPDVTFFNPVSMEYDILHDRPPLLLEGSCELQFGTFPIAVMAVHNRSLSGIDGSEGERVRKKRLLQAESIATKVQEMQSSDPDVRLVVTGDFNAFEFTDGYVDSLSIIAGDFDPAMSFVCSEAVCMGDLVEPNLTNQVLSLDAGERYSFIFRGNAQALDHALTSAKLADEITGVEYGRGNADAAVDLINDDGSEEPANLPLRSSDHDGLVVYISKDKDADGVPNDADVCPATVIPEDVPTKRLGTNRFALTDWDGLFDTKAPNGKGPRLSFTLGDTAGCSCEQIIAVQGLGNGHTKFGCSIGAMQNWISLVNP